MNFFAIMVMLQKKKKKRVEISREKPDMQENTQKTDSDRGRRIAIMAIKENTPKKVEEEMLNLISNGYTLEDLKKAGYVSYLS